GASGPDRTSQAPEGGFRAMDQRHAADGIPLSTLLHDLRNYLNSIKMPLTLLKMDRKVAGADQYIQQMERSLEDLSRFLDGLRAESRPVNDRPAAPRAPSGEGPSRPRRILVVDDSRDGADSMGKLLTGMGHEARTFYSGAGVREVVREFRPDVVL